MLKRLSTIFVALLMVINITAQDNNLVVQKKQIVDDSKQTTEITGKVGGNIMFPVSNPAVGDTVAMTTYDYFSNSIIRDQVIFYNNAIHLAPMVRPWPTTTNTRVNAYIRRNTANTAYEAFNIFGGTNAGGWPQIDVQLRGSNVGQIGIVGHSPSRLALWDGSGFSVSQFDASSDPSLQFLGDTIWLAASGNRINYKFYRTSDFGTNYTMWDSINSPTFQSVLPWIENGPVEVGMSKSANEQNLIMFSGNDLRGNMSATVVRDSANFLWTINTSNAGRTWTPRKIAISGDRTAVVGYHTPNFAPLFANFGQMDAAIANNGISHVVTNGYGAIYQNATSDSVVNFQFPVLYWNSRDNRWISISARAQDTLPSAILATLRPANGIGQSYPAISVSPDGQVLHAMWTGPQMTAGRVDTAQGFFLTDLYHTVSYTSGRTWHPVTVFAGRKNMSESFGHGSQYLQETTTSYVAHILYLEDTAPGVSIGTPPGPISNSALIYRTFTFPKTSSTDAVVTEVNNYTLSQNYPNPFNPSTKIDFNLPEAGMVSLKVYDILGNEVATLVNREMNIGSYSVDFNASDLSSGIYFYTLRAGNNVLTNKMTLLK